MKRSFFFLKDSLTGKFYTGEQNYLSDFSDAAVFHSEANAKKKLKVHMDKWTFTQDGLDFWADRAKKGLCDKKWAKEEKDSVVSRQDIKDWGIEIVSVEVNAP
jgi:hypothetical protein